MTAVVVVAVLVLAAAALAYRYMPRATGGPARQVESFAAARAVTNRWASDPTSTPAPLKEFLGEQQRAPEQRTAEQERPEGEA